MPNYRETAASGTQWQRCAAIVITNPYGGTPSIRMDEETIAMMGGEKFIKSVGCIESQFNPAEIIPLINPETGEALGQTMTFMEMYVALHSLYLAKATARDAG